MKKDLLARIDAHFADARTRRKDLAAKPDYVEDVLRDGAKRARAEARATMALVRDACGLSGRAE